MPLKFAELHLMPELHEAIAASGFSECTPIQEVTIPPILEGKDVAGLAQTGTGKTAAFLLPLMDRILRSRQEAPPGDEAAAQRRFSDWQPGHFVLILVPTRELAEQVYENILKLRGKSSLESVAVYGGVAYDKQKTALRDGVQFVVATPGRLIDLYKEHVVDLRQVRAVVFDEADRMFDMGFKDDMKYVLTRLPKDRQFLVFSATLNFDVLNTAYQFGAHPVECNVSRDQAKAENVEDKIFHVGHEEKPRHLLSLLQKHQPKQAIIFSNFKNNVSRITHFLNSNDVPSVGISSLLTQAQRNRVMEQFKGSSNRNILVATDVAARGLDIKGVDMVINYELPDDPENYVHRIGRTGRAGANGIAFSFVSDRDVDALTRIEDYLKHKITQDWLEDAELIDLKKPFPSERDMDRPRSGSSRDAGPGRRGPGGRPDRGPAGRPDRGPRPERSGERRPDRPRRPERSGEPLTASPGPHPAGQHRDKLTGRHGARMDGLPEQRRASTPSTGQNLNGRDQHRSGRRPQRSDNRHQPRHQDNRRPEMRNGSGRHATAPRRDGKPSAPTAAKAGLGQKVSGFFKKLFGK